MARIAGVDLPRRKQLEIALTDSVGVGQSRAKEIVEKSEVDGTTKVQEMTEEEVRAVRQVIDDDYKVEGDLRREVQMNIKRLKDLGCYRGLRHRKGLPVRGQQTKTNARTRKGPRRPIKR